MYSMLYYLMWFWKDHVVVHMFKNQIMHRILNEEMQKMQKILSFLENSTPMLIPFIVLNKIQHAHGKSDDNQYTWHATSVKSKRDIGEKRKT